MNLVAFHAAFLTRLGADSTLINTYLGSSNNIYFGQVPTDGDLDGNSLVLNLFGDSHQDGGDKDIVDMRLEVTILVARDGDEGPDAALYIHDRLYGDGIDQAGNVPTYGFHRLPTLTLASPASTSYQLFGFRHESFGPIDSTDPELYLAYQTTFNFHMQTL